MFLLFYTLFPRPRLRREAAAVRIGVLVVDANLSKFLTSHVLSDIFMRWLIF